MAYEPLALKYRPRQFSDLVGQGAVAETLCNALKAERVANAFLFSGSRGVGKTSTARILAKALVCPRTEAGESCGDCDMCLQIARGEHMDVIEVDGASNRGIDEIRAIRDHAGYTPTSARFKIYIIDEVHMLTIQAFNALLKTLEEPPPHVKFIFATTEAQALPETILSRCQHYEFRRISPKDIVGRLRHIAEAEGIEAEDGVFDDIASKAEGGLRDSISLLDQVISFAGESVAMDDLDRVLGRIDSELLEALIVRAGDGDVGALLDTLDDVFESGRDAEDVLLQLVEVLRESMLRTARDLPGGGEGRRARVVAEVRERFSLDRQLFSLRIALNTRREMKLAGQSRLQLELAILKIARSRDLVPIQELLDRLGGAPPSPAPSPAQPSGQPSAQHSAQPPRERTPWKPPEKKPGKGSTVSERPTAPAPPVKPADHGAPPTLARLQGEWGSVLAAIRKRSPQVGAYLEGGAVESLQGTELKILLPAGQTFARDKLEGGLVAVATEVTNEYLGTKLSLCFEVAGRTDAGPAKTPKRSVYEDRDVRKILDTFEGSVMSVENEDQS